MKINYKIFVNLFQLIYVFLLLLCIINKFEHSMSFKNKIAESKSFWTIPIKLVFYNYYNKYYNVNDIIKKSYIDKDDDLVVELTDGTYLSSPASKYKADILFTERYKYGKKRRMSKIIDVDKFFFLYEILSELFVNGNYFKYHQIKSGDIVLDAGANIGGFVVQAAKVLNNTGQIYAFEPNADNIKTLQKNLKLNDITNCEIIDLGLWSETKKMEFFISHRPGEHTLINYDDTTSFQKKGVLQINCDKLDNIVQRYKIEKIDYLKMDIEGAEIEALKGGKQCLSNFNPFLLIEALHTIEGIPTYKTIVPYLKEFGYNLLENVDNYRGTIFAKK